MPCDKAQKCRLIISRRAFSGGEAGAEGLTARRNTAKAASAAWRSSALSSSGMPASNIAE
jgi:hypothetical protein